jgi:hypothetical protein
MKKLLLVVSMLGLAGAAVPALAHHSFAMFENDKNMTLEGTVKEFQWTNPHTWIQLLVTGADGKVTEWSIEGGSPNGLRRQGWRAESIKAGDKVSVVIRPLKSGEPGGALVSVTLPDGKVLGRQIAAGATSGD